MKKDFIVTRSIEMIEGKIHVETISERELVHCKDCALNCFSPDHESVSYWIPCQEIKPEPHYFCWAGKLKAQKQN